jgi:hypothetical protein
MPAWDEAFKTNRTLASQAATARLGHGSCRSLRGTFPTAARFATRAISFS